MTTATIPPAHHMPHFAVTTNIYSLDKIKKEAQSAAAKYTNMNDACPYPFHTTEGYVFREEFLWVRSVIEQKEKQEQQQQQLQGQQA